MEEGENACKQQFFPFSHNVRYILSIKLPLICCLQMLFFWTHPKFCPLVKNSKRSTQIKFRVFSIQDTDNDNKSSLSKFARRSYHKLRFHNFLLSQTDWRTFLSQAMTYDHAIHMYSATDKFLSSVSVAIFLTGQI